METTIKITDTAEVRLPIYIKEDDGRYLAILGLAPGKADKYSEMQVRERMIATWHHMDAQDVIKAIMGKEQIGYDEFIAAYESALREIHNTLIQ